MRWAYSVSFEHDMLPVRTFRGLVDGGVGAASRRAVDLARKQSTHKLTYRSVVVVLEKQAEQDE